MIREEHSNFFKLSTNAQPSLNCQKAGGCSKRLALSSAQTQGGQDALFHGKGRRGFGAWSLQGAREGERRQVCEREARQRPENAVGDPFDKTQDRLFQQPH